MQYAREKAKDCKTCGTIYGKTVPITIDIKRDGKIIPVSGGKLYIVTLKSENAKGMQFHFSKYRLPKVASLFIYNENYNAVLGAFTHINNHPDGKFATQAISGKTITIEYFEANKNEFDGELELFRVMHVFRDGYIHDPTNAKTEGQSQPCETDASCDTYSLANLRNRGVCRISTVRGDGYGSYCSGALLNNGLNGTRKPYVLTAYHCYQPGYTEGTKMDELFSWTFEFSYQKPCNSTSTPTSESYVRCVIAAGSTDYVHFGQSSSYGGDYVLLDLQAVKLESYINVVYLGWDLATSPHPTTVGIHHPNGDYKKISKDFDPPVQVAVDHSGNSITENPTASYNAWKVTWNEGITEGGSSGSPLLDQMKVIGILSGGTSYCLPGQPQINGPDYYMQMAYMWRFNDSDVSNYNLSERLYDGASSLPHYVPPSPTVDDPTGPGCPTYAEGVKKGHPSFSIDFNAEFNDQCLRTWRTLSGAVRARCIKTASNSANNAAEMPISSIWTSEIAHPYNFHPNQDYVVTIKVASDAASQPYLGKLKVVLKYDVLPYAAPSGQCSDYVGGIGIRTDDQIIMELTPAKLYTGANKFATYAVKFRPTREFTWIDLKYTEGTGGQTSWSHIFVDDLNIYETGNFINNQCVDDGNYFWLDPVLFGTQIMTNNSIIAEKTANGIMFGHFPTVESGQTLEMRSKSITLKNGFTAKSGSTFYARTGECINYTSATSPVGPLETPNNSTLVRLASNEEAPDPTVLFDYYNRENIHRPDLMEASLEQTPVLFEGQKIIVSPNPTRGKISGRFVTSLERVPYTLYDSYGREMMKGVSDTSFEFDLGQYAEGIYILKASLQGKNEVVKIMLRK